MTPEAGDEARIAAQPDETTENRELEAATPGTHGSQQAACDQLQHVAAHAGTPEHHSQAADTTIAAITDGVSEDDLEPPPGLGIEAASLPGTAPGLPGTTEPAGSEEQPRIPAQQQHAPMQEEVQHESAAAQPAQEETSDDSDIPDIDTIEQDASATQIHQTAQQTSVVAAHVERPPLPPPQQQQQQQQEQQEPAMPTAVLIEAQHCSSSTAENALADVQQTGASDAQLQAQRKEASEWLPASVTQQQPVQTSETDASQATAHPCEQELRPQEQCTPQQEDATDGHGMQGDDDTAPPFVDIFADSHDVFASAYSEASAQPIWHTAVAGSSLFASVHTAFTPANSSMFRSAGSTDRCAVSISGLHVAGGSCAQAVAVSVPEAGAAALDAVLLEGQQAVAAVVASEAGPGALQSEIEQGIQRAAGSSDAAQEPQTNSNAPANDPLAAPAVSTALQHAVDESTGSRFSTCSTSGNDVLLQRMEMAPEASVGQASLLLPAAQPLSGYSVLVGPARGAGNAAGSMSSMMAQSQLQLMQEKLGSAAHATSATRQSGPAAARQMPSSFMLRNSELVDLSLSTSVHPLMPVGALPQELPPLPPAAQLAVRRAASALDSDDALLPLPRGRRGSSAARGQLLHSGGVHGSNADECSEEGVLVERTADMPVSMEAQEAAVFAGLVFCDGRDSHGRPVVVVNTDAIPNGVAAADAALQYLMRRMWPLVQGPYVLVLVACTGSRRPWLLPAMWCVRAYRGLARPFRKNVRFVVVVQPSMLVRTAMNVVKPFVSKKAHAKLKQVHTLLDIDRETNGEVQVAHLGEAFLSALQSMQQERLRQEEQQQQQQAERHWQEHQAPAVLQPLAQMLHWPTWRW